MGVPLLQGERTGVPVVAGMVGTGLHHEVVLTVVLIVLVVGDITVSGRWTWWCSGIDRLQGEA